MAETHLTSNVSQDLVWEITRNNNAFLVKRNTGGGSQFSRDPLNLVNKQSRKYSGYANNKAVGVRRGEKGGITLTTKKTKHLNRPASNENQISWGANTSGPKVYRGIVNQTAKQGYRADLRQEAVARASAIKQSQQTKKASPAHKARGASARKAQEGV